jgi:hypothetical protein
MSDVVSDCDAGMALAMETAKELYKRDPNHELLRFFEKADDDKIWNEFQERFGIRDATKAERNNPNGRAYLFVHYFLALKKALGESSTIEPDRSITVRSDLHDIVEDSDVNDDLPF